MGELGAGLGSDYPASIDTDSTKEANDGEASPTTARAEVPNDLADAIVNIETELGVDPAGAYATVVARLNALNTIVQVVNVQTGAYASGTTAIPNDDSIPAITEGDEYMTLAITPKDTNNLLKVDVVVSLSASGAAMMIVALFQDAATNALAASMGAIGSADYPCQIKFTHWMTAGTISATTFRIRAGHASGSTTYFNGAGGSRKMGGVMASSITITEITV